MTSQMATCSTAQWTFNSRGQSPCVVGSALAGACVGGDFTLTALQPDFVYLGPSVSAATPCRCSSVYYSMLSACATCQGNNFIRWGRYSTNCTTVYSSVFPRDIPDNIAVPAWAYMDVEAQDTFNLTLAQSFGGVESTAPVQSTASSTGSTTRNTGTGGSTSTGINPGATSGGSSGGTESKSNAGAIAGGVVGGIVGLALIAGLIFFLLRRNKKQKQLPPSALYGPQGTVHEKPQVAMSQYTGDGSVSGMYSHSGMPAPQVYDPNNPATFPSSDGSMSYTQTPPPGQYGAPPSPGFGQTYGVQPNGNYIPPHTTGQSANSGYTQGNTTITQPNAPRYTGAPEL